MTEGKPGLPEDGEPVIRDKRRIDPETGEVRQAPADAQEAEENSNDNNNEDTASVAESVEVGLLKQQLSERTTDLQRLQAEFQNYRKRVERDRSLAGEVATVKALSELLPVLDDIGRARDHSELTGGFKSVGESLETIVAKMGLQAFGKKGEPFDPNLHEALLHSYTEDVTEPTCVEILQPGYTVHDKVIRPARVAVAEPAESGEASGDND